MRVGIATDHGGFGLKEELVAQLRATGHEVVDFGASSLSPDDDYPDFVIPLAHAVAAGTVDRGVAIAHRLKTRTERGAGGESTVAPRSEGTAGEQPVEARRGSRNRRDLVALAVEIWRRREQQTLQPRIQPAKPE